MTFDWKGTSLTVFMSLTLSGCLYGQCMEGMCALTRETYLKSIKSYLQYWEKPETKDEERLRDWQSCGGMPNGSYSIDEPSGSPTAVLLASAERRRLQLDECMVAKGYLWARGIR